MNDQTKTPEQIAAEQAATEKLAAADKAAAKAEPKAAPPAWQLPGYAGPLDINQAQWRQRNIKPEPAPKSK